MARKPQATGGQAAQSGATVPGGDNPQDGTTQQNPAGSEANTETQAGANPIGDGNPEEGAAQQNPGDSDAGAGTQEGANAPGDGNPQEGNEEQQAKEAPQAKEPKVSDALAKAGKALLDSNPGMSVVYMTADGRGFYEKNDADNYARALKNKAVTAVKR